MNPSTTLHRAIGRTTLVLLVINSIIGAGIFGLPSKIFALAGTASLWAFGLCALVVLVFVGCFAEVSTRFQQTGGPYTYILSAFGRGPAFAMGWLLLLSRIFNYAALINLLVTYSSIFIPQTETPWLRAGIITFITAALTLLNYVGVKNAARFSNAITVAKLLPLALLIIVGLLAAPAVPNTITTAVTAASFSQAVLLLIFAFGGFESVLINTGEIQEPRKNLPVGLAAGVLTVTLFYCLIQWVCMHYVPGLETSTTPVADAATQLMGRGGRWLIAAGALVSITGTLNVLLLSGSRLPYAFSIEGQLPPFLSSVHPRFVTPVPSLLLFALVTWVFSLGWGFLSAITVGALIRLLVYLLVCLSLIRLRQKQQAAAGHFHLPGGVAFALLGVGLAIWLLFSSKAAELKALGYCLLAGAVVYVINGRIKSKKANSKTEPKEI